MPDQCNTPPRPDPGTLGTNEHRIVEHGVERGLGPRHPPVRTRWGVIGGSGGSLHPIQNRRREARRAPSTSASNLAHMTVGCWRW
jgi:hypothetical protein